MFLQCTKPSQRVRLLSCFFLSLFFIGLVPVSASTAQQAVTDANGILLTIKRVKALSDLDRDAPWPIPDCGEADFFAVTTINGEEQATSMIDDRDEIHPNWTHTVNVGQSSGPIAILIRLYDYDEALCFGNDHVDIKEAPGKDLTLTLDITTCQISGDLSGNCWEPLVSKGTERDRAEIEFTIQRLAPFTHFSGSVAEIVANQPMRAVSNQLVRVIDHETNQEVATAYTDENGTFAFANLIVRESARLRLQLDECSGPLYCDHKAPTVLSADQIQPIERSLRTVIFPPCPIAQICTYAPIGFTFEQTPNYVEVHAGSEDGPVIPNAEIYRLQLNGAIDPQPWRTDASGGVAIPGLQPGERLIAMVPQHKAYTDSEAYAEWDHVAYTIYTTSMTRGADGEAQLFEVPNITAVHRLVVRPENTLIAFNIVASVEWDSYSVDDANNGDVRTFLDTLSSSFTNANRFLFDVSEGQFIFRNVKLYDGARYWHDADFRIVASNRARPYTLMGGEKPSDGPFVYHAANSYVLLGRYWNRYATIFSNQDPPLPLSEQPTLDNPDGWRVLVHEFMHRAVGVLDEYFYIDEATGELHESHCYPIVPPEANPADYGHNQFASIMADPYLTSELSPQRYTELSEDCLRVHQMRVNQETAWETLVRHYSDPQQRWQIRSPLGAQPNPGPTLPALLQVRPVKVPPARNILNLVNQYGEVTLTIYREGNSTASDQVQVYLLKRQPGGSLKAIIPQGTVTTNGSITVAGVERDEGDEILAISADGQWVGTAAYHPDLQSLTLQPSSWSPVVTAVPLTDSEHNLIGLTINADLYNTLVMPTQITGTLMPFDRTTPPLSFTLTRVDATANRYRAEVLFVDQPIREAHIWLQAPAVPQAGTTALALRQTVATYADGGSPGSHARAYVDASASNGACAIHYPSAAIPAEQRSKLFNLMMWSLNAPPLPETESSFIVSQACYYQPSIALTENVTGTLVIFLNKQVLEQIDPSRFRIYHWSDAGGQWITPFAVNVDKLYLTAPINQPGLFAIAIEPKPETLAAEITSSSATLTTGEQVPISPSTLSPTATASAIEADQRGTRKIYLPLVANN